VEKEQKRISRDGNSGKRKGGQTGLEGETPSDVEKDPKG